MKLQVHVAPDRKSMLDTLCRAYENRSTSVVQLRETVSQWFEDIAHEAVYERDGLLYLALKALKALTENPHLDLEEDVAEIIGRNEGKGPSGPAVRHWHQAVANTRKALSAGQRKFSLLGDLLTPAIEPAAPQDGDPGETADYYRQAYEAAIKERDELRVALEESVKLQSHYVELLNMYDPGTTRMSFADANAWLARIRGLRTKKEGQNECGS